MNDAHFFLVLLLWRGKDRPLLSARFIMVSSTNCWSMSSSCSCADLFVRGFSLTIPPNSTSTPSSPMSSSSSSVLFSGSFSDSDSVSPCLKLLQSLPGVCCDVCWVVIIFYVEIVRWRLVVSGGRSSQLQLGCVCQVHAPL